ncbi:hypothetical protein M0R45_027096 [Rubus argutus]|uniref:Uncharacterized protein n=1 Tax=Rubus argutus TaxID=59490 RepID=A0AAW1WZC7_RUBAR
MRPAFALLANGVLHRKEGEENKYYLLEHVITNHVIARQNLADTFVNAFVNAGFGQGKLVTVEPSKDHWLFKNKEHGKTSAAASLAIILALMDRSDAELGEPLARLIPLSFGLLYLGKQENVEATAQVSQAFNEKTKKHIVICLCFLVLMRKEEMFSRFKTFSAIVQNILRRVKLIRDLLCLELLAMIAMAEELGLEMAINSFEHLLQYGQQNIRKAVPLALGLLCISNPNVNVMDTLSRLSHDTNSELAMSAVISLG